MDSHQRFSFGSNRHGPLDGHEVHGLLEQPPKRPLESGPSALEPPYLNPFQANMAYQLQGNNDVSMVYSGVDEQPTKSAARPQTHIGPSQRSKYASLDWNAHKAAIKSLYMEQNKSLPETMEAMKNLYSFDASQKLYKAKFKEWNWQKNLPAETAVFMTTKAKQRKQEQGKDTLFSFGGRLWDLNRVESSLVRTKKPRIREDLADAETPRGVSYKTPKTFASSPPSDTNMDNPNVDDIEISDDDHVDDAGNISRGDPAGARALTESNLALSWHGYSRSDLQDMWHTARAYRDAGRLNEAEDMFRQVRLGMSRILGATNEDTVKAAYNLADLYADSGQMNEAVEIIEEVIQNHVKTWGYEDKRTQQNVLQAVELLNGWNRQADALALLSLSWELLDSFSHSNTRRVGNRAIKLSKEIQRPIPNASHADVSDVFQSGVVDLNSTNIDYGIGVARAHVAAKDQAAEGLLLAIISQCKDQPDLAVQQLNGHAELLRLYDKLGQTDEHEEAFEQALETLTKDWDAYEWKEDEIESFNFMEASLQLVANMLKCGYRIEARRMFREAADKASEIFESSDERTVWVLITIGLIYQTHMTWDDAQEWFEEAFAAALANKNWGPKDGIVRALQNAMDHQHFSYVSDKGRPFKTIFGVSGITITPGRLHLE